MRAAAPIVLALLGSSCAPAVPGPELTPVDPHLHVFQKSVAARQLAPVAMVMVDTSAAAGPQLGDLRAVLGTFLQSHRETAVWGLTRFPSSTALACSSAGFDVLAPIPTLGTTDDQVDANTSNVIAALDTLTSGGDRDVSAALRSTARANPNRDNFVLLITSGDDACGEPLVDTVRALRAVSIRTIVVSFGAAAVPLDEAALAGGFPRRCPLGTDAECGAENTCDAATHLCQRSSYVARDAAELGAVLEQLGAVTPADPSCRFTLELLPSRPERLTVLVDAAVTPPGDDTWQLAGGQVRFQGALCDRLRASTPFAPVKIELRIDDRP